MNDYGEMFYGTLPPDTKDFRQVLSGIGKMLRDRALAAGERIGQSGQEAIALQNQIFGDPNRPLRVTDENALRRYTDMIMGGPLGFAPAGITAYHGSPYLFRQLNPAKVGTGEGNQAYGVGAGYTSEGRPVAESYRASVAAQKQRSGQNMGEITINGKPINWDKPEEVAAFELARHAGDRKAAADFHARTFLGGENNPAVKLLRSKKDLPKADMPGYLYKGDIPDEILPKFLDWDKPLSQQSKEVQKALAKLDPDFFSPKGGDYSPEELGQMIYARIANSPLAKNQAEATAVLESAGIRGIRYLDQGSRGEGKGTSNFIPFRAEDYKIQEINDIPIEDWIRRGLLGP
jgi:hypothetical protein